MLNGLGDISVAHYPVFSVENLSIVCNNKLNHMLPAGFSMSLSVYWFDNLTLLYSKTSMKELSQDKEIAAAYGLD